MKKILLIIIFFITSCGYQPIYLNKILKNNEFYKITLEGDIDINKKIVNALSLKENEFDDTLNNLMLTTSFDEIVTSKNSKGQIKSYRSQIRLSLIVKNKKEEILNKMFIEQFSYNNKDNKFELLQYQEEVKNNLINKIIEQAILYINL
tara:strand:- start:1413 stop:1859 length:447 start_codon:yes stop_codon:yes gene_type:complete